MLGILVVLQLLLCFVQPVCAHVLRDGFRRQAGDYLVGTGKADITGPVVELNFMGYADPSQVGTGLRQRLYTRAFIVGNPSDSSERIVYLVLDTATGDTAIRDGILKGVAALGGEYSVYNKNNIAVTGTHSHSGPGAWVNYLLPQVTSLGFSHQSYDAIVQGSVLAIQRAHQSLTTGSLSVGAADLVDGNINRSPYAYDQNPAAEKAQYQYNTDKTMTLLKLTRSSDGKAIGILNWYPVHGTSLYESNTLATADNKGVAAYLFENFAATDANAAPGFVAGFSQANVGDTTPNVLGAYCSDTGLPCQYNDSTCGGKTQNCHGRGPYWQIPDNGTKSCFEIGTRQFNAAKSIYQSTSFTPITGSTVTGFHTYQDLNGFSFTSPLTGAQVTACSAALGYGFAGGTTDGPGFADFTQGANTSDPSPAQKNPLWAIASAAIHIPSPAQVACQQPKQILFDAGATTVPYQWAPNIMDVQLLRVGSLIMIISPGEATTMSGRRWKSAIAAAATSKLAITNPVVVLGGPANTYGHYIATQEEYGVQRYEGASTLHGPHSLEAHIYLTVQNLPALASQSSATAIPDGPNPPINTNNSLSFIAGVVYDNAPLGKSFGSVVTNPSSSATYSSTAYPTTVFVAANPRNNLHLESNYATIERQNADGSWTTYRTDFDWSLVFQWARTNTVLGYSQVSITWEIESTGVQSGTYRMRYFGESKQPITGSISSFSGTSGTFKVQGS
ncbi:Neutral/alkaline nonlysosomal ceramidase [Myriangium duriaei CBS 260.36]|uniref:Neutral ceramidase n=1 Tax=Myriangium duriaei CBS 260.36 TaxID=1168546 RepID=A0A9P4IYP2_9PEZI|nr:Neutral/alkaline nonlysosomal ceramidase [Myriangium duriaei CBS 260.36]